MARVVTIDDYPLYAQMMADLLGTRGHYEVRALLNPIVIAEITEFDPDVIVVTLVRKLEALGHGRLHDFYSEVDGGRALRSLQMAPEIGKYPIVLSVIGVLEADIPKELRYLSMVHVPHEMDLLFETIDNILRARAKGSDITEA